MNKEEEMLAIRKLVFELTLAVSMTSDLDTILEKLFGILQGIPDIPLESRGAAVLLNPRGSYFQVAQFGMPPAWESPSSWDSASFNNSVIAKGCKTEDISLGKGADQSNILLRMVLLPLHIDANGVGYIALFAPLDYEMSSVDADFFNDLARALSGLVQRVLMNETLYVRELELENARAEALQSLGTASEYRDNETGWHIMRMTNIAQVIAKVMGLSEDQRDLLYLTAPMHDVGKIGISDSILLKPSKLTTEEFEIMKSHTSIGAMILKGNDSIISTARDIANSHHERWDGNGYPDGLAGDKIPLLGRICAVADVFDALTSKRPYKNPWPVEEAHAWIMSESGKQFDPSVANAFNEAMPDILRIRELYNDDIIDPKRVLTLPPIRHRENVWIHWDSSLCIGIDIIDEHHRYLFDLINDLYAVVINKRGTRQVTRLIKSLDSYAKIHFRAEEQMMRHYGYDQIDSQLHQHHAFEEKIAEFYEELHSNPLVAQFDVLSYMRKWLTQHILIEDAQLVSLAKA